MIFSLVVTVIILALTMANVVLVAKQLREQPENKEGITILTVLGIIVLVGLYVLVLRGIETMGNIS